VSLVVENVSAFYGNLQVLWDVSITVEKGEIVALIGANGAGKSTLLRSVIGLVKPKQGNISFDGDTVLNKSTHSRVKSGIGYVAEGHRLFYAMTVEENLRMGAPRVSPGLELRMKEVYNLFPILRERRKQYAGNLSGGEQQMLSIGRAFMSNPKLILLDELSFGLSPIAFDRVIDSVKGINGLGVSVLFAEQNAERALEISARTYVLQNGRIAMSGKSEDLVNDPSIRSAYLGMSALKA
jgi:branched-chain amino acid transport system ATP-binding protein